MSNTNRTTAICLSIMVGFTILSLLCGCARKHYDSPPLIRFDSASVVSVRPVADTEKDYDALAWATNHWDRLIDENVVLYPDIAEADIVVVFVNNVTVCEGTIDTSFTGCARVDDVRDTNTARPVVVRVERQASLNDTKQTTAHEIGHALGFGHTSDTTSVMYQSE